MKIYTVITQAVYFDGYHTNSINNFRTLDKAKNFIDSCVECQKKLEGDVFYVTETSGLNIMYGWMFSSKVVYGVEMKRSREHSSHEICSTERFILETEIDD